MYEPTDFRCEVLAHFRTTNRKEMISLLDELVEQYGERTTIEYIEYRGDWGRYPTGLGLQFLEFVRMDIANRKQRVSMITNR